jgi:hypothetical protein
VWRLTRCSKWVHPSTELRPLDRSIDRIELSGLWCHPTDQERRGGIWPDEVPGNLVKPPRCQRQPGDGDDRAQQSNQRSAAPRSEGFLFQPSYVFLGFNGQIPSRTNKGGCYGEIWKFLRRSLQKLRLQLFTRHGQRTGICLLDQNRHLYGLRASLGQSTSPFRWKNNSVASRYGAHDPYVI